jgi:Glycosyltransferase family 87
LIPAVLVGYGLFLVHQVVALPGANLEFDFRQFHRAAQDLAAGRDPYSVYLDCCRNSVVAPLKGYIYPPLLALLMRPLAGLPEVPAAAVWLGVLNAALLGALVAAYRGLRPLLSTDAMRWLLAGTLMFPPLLENLGFMQIGTPIIFVTVLAGTAFLQPRTTPRSGLWIAIGGALRVSPALAGLALVRRESASARGIGVAVVAGLVLALVMLVATPRLPEFVTQVLPNLGHGSAVFDNQAPSGVALRLQLLVFNGRADALKYAGSLVSLLVGFATFIFCRGPAVSPRRRAAVFAAWVAAIPLVSSITWTHHLATELVVLAFVAPSLAFASRAWWLAVLAYPLLWLHRVVELLLVMVGLHDARYLGGPALVVLSATGMCGMLLLWAACLDVLRPGDRQLLNHG